ncbi:MAG: hypothetical protein NT040_12690 [Bacteroidetes bacterium]|nr:hypothetical protein [Bacteroidota bacterium]
MKMSNNRKITGKMMISFLVTIGLQLNFLFAANPVENVLKSRSVKCENCSENALTILLAPSVPAEATFSDEVTTPDINLAPATPSEASFEEDSELSCIFTPAHLAPSVTGEASFDDEPSTAVNFNIFAIAPITPADDDFND